MRVAWSFGVVIVLLGAASARADTLTCAVFRERLAGSVLAAGAKDAVTFRPGFTDASHHTRDDWGDQRIGGALRCGPSDEFEEFGLSLQFNTKETFVDDLNRFMVMQGAIICALAQQSASGCKQYGRSMLQEALEQMGRNANRGAKTPSGLVDRTLFAGASAELTSAPSLVTFVVGPGHGGTVDTSRPALPEPAENPP